MKHIVKRLIEHPDFGELCGRSKWSSFFGQVIRETNKAYMLELYFEPEEVDRGEIPKKTNPFWLPKKLCFLKEVDFLGKLQSIKAISLMVKANVFGQEYVQKLKKNFSPLNITVSVVSRTLKWIIQKQLDPLCPTCNNHAMCKLWGIEILECGVWQDIDYAESLEDALTLASSVVGSENKFRFNVREEHIRIVTPDNQIL